MLNVDDYKLNKNISENTLKKVGFKFGTVKRNIYKDIISFVMHIDNETGNWDYEVISSNTDSPYASYYNRTFGKNNVVQDLDNEITKIMDELVHNKIFRKRRRNKSVKTKNKKNKEI